jgi:hypothetical protein
MGAGLSKEQIRKRIYGRMQVILHRLQKAGVDAKYKEGTVKGERRDRKNVVKACFRFYYRASQHASNGEVFLPQRVYLYWSGKVDTFLESHDEGITKVIELFGQKKRKISRPTLDNQKSVS